jgi:hypothetical protein
MAPRPATPVRTLTRKEFFDLTEYCRTYAAELARYDQHRVNLKQCHRFNGWLAEVKRYDKLRGPLGDLAPARPIARWQILVLLIVLWLILWLALPGRVDRGLEAALLIGGTGTIILTFFLPESLYGTTTRARWGSARPPSSRRERTCWLPTRSCASRSISRTGELLHLLCRSHGSAGMGLLKNASTAST